jgi:hypothetical protein
MYRHEPLPDLGADRRRAMARVGLVASSVPGGLWVGPGTGRRQGAWPAIMGGGAASAAQVLQLQRTAGNAAVASYFGSSVQRVAAGGPVSDDASGTTGEALPVALCAGGVIKVDPLVVEAGSDDVETTPAQPIPSDTGQSAEAEPLDAPGGTVGATATSAPACPVPADLSVFQDKPGGDGSGLAALTASGLGGFQHGGFTTTFDPASSWVDTDIVTKGGKRAGNTKKRVAAGLASFANGNTFYTSTGQTTCAAAPSISRTANTVAEVESVIGAGLDADGIANEPRLLNHEQYHVKLVCAAARKAGATLPPGTTKVTKQVKAVYDALGQVLDKNSKQYDVDSSNGCDAAGQKKAQADIDAGKVPIA